MSLKDKLFETGTRVLSHPTVMRVATDDRVMKLAEGLMDAPTRLQGAWKSYATATGYRTSIPLSTKIVPPPRKPMALATLQPPLPAPHRAPRPTVKMRLRRPR